MALPDFNVDQKELKLYMKTKMLKRKSQVTGIIRTTLNKQASATRVTAKTKTIKKNMKVRNKFVNNSVRSDFAKGTNTRTMFSEVGSKKRFPGNKGSDFTGLKEQELGSRIDNPAIPTIFTRGGSESNIVKPGFRFNRLGETVEIDPTNQGRMVSIIEREEKKGDKIFFKVTKSGRTKSGGMLKKGFYKFGNKRFKWKGKSHKHLRQIKDQSNSSIKLRRRPWLAEARKKAVTKQTTAKFYKEAYNKFTTERLR